MALYIIVTRQFPNFSVALYFLQITGKLTCVLAVTLYITITFAISQGWPVYTGLTVLSIFNAEQ